MITAKQNQKLSFLNFRFSAGGVGGADKKWKGNFWFLLPRPKGADEVRIICFEKRYELGTIQTPIRNSTIFSVDTSGRRKAPTKDFLAGLQGNSEFLARKRAEFFRRGGGAKSEAILTHSICFGYKKNFYYYDK